MKILAPLLLVVIVALGFAAEQRPPVGPITGDWHEAMKSADTTAPDSLVRHLAGSLKQSKVPTEEEARRKAFPLVTDARSLVRVNALLRLAKPVKDLGTTGDFVWEVRVLWGSDLADVIWVGASTGNAKSLFPK